MFMESISICKNFSYVREYYLYQGMRFTFDSDIRYEHSKQKTISDFERVLEIKSPINAPDDFLITLF